MKIKLKKKKYSSGGQIGKDIGAGAYGLGEGLVDNLTSVIPGVGGIVDTGTDKLFNMLNKNNKEATKVRAVGDVVGNVGGAILTGGATTLGAVTNGLGATNEFIQNTNMSDKGKQITGITSGLATTVAGLTGTGKVEGVNGLADIGKMIKYKKGGGVNKNILSGDPPPSWTDSISNLLDTPQKSMMYALTQAKLLPQESWDASSGYRTPSEYLIRNEYMDKNNKAGALAVDGIFDPNNLVGGLGLITKGAKALGAANKVLKSAKAADFATGFLPNAWQMATQQHANGGAIQNNNLMPYNPNDLAGVSNNLIRYDGNTHSNGGIPTPSGEFDKQETVLNSKEPYAFSDNLLVTKPLAQMQGLPKKYINKTIADASKMVDDKYKIKVNQPTLLQNANRITADNKLNDLVKTNEMLIDAEQQLGTQYMCGGKVNKYAYGGVMQKFRLGGNPPKLDEFGLPIDDSYNTNYDGLDNRNQFEQAPNSVNKLSQIRSIDKNPMFMKDAVGINGTPNLQANQALYNTPDVQAMQKSNQAIVNNNLLKSGDSSLLASGISTNANPTGNMFSKLGMSPLEAASLGTKLASHAYEFASVLKKPDRIQTQYNEFNPQVQRLMREQKVNNQPMLNELNLQSNMLFDRNVGNANTQRANNLSVNSQLMDKINQVKMASQTANNQYRQQEANTLTQMGQQNVNARNTQEALQSATNAARDNAIRDAFGNVGNDLADYGLKKDVNNKTITEGFKLLGEDVRFSNIQSIYKTPQKYMKALQRPEVQGIAGKLDADDTLSEKDIKYLEDHPTELSLVATIRKGQIERLFDLDTKKRRNPIGTATPKERKTEAEIAEKEAKTEK
jgi:hypothetical protein